MSAAIREARQACLELLGWSVTTEAQHVDGGAVIWHAQAWKSTEEHRSEYNVIRDRALSAVLDYATGIENEAAEYERCRDTDRAPAMEGAAE